MKQNDKLDRELMVNTDEDVEQIVDSLSRTEIAGLSVCMTACLPGRMDGWTDGRMDGWTDGRMGGWTDGRMDGWTDGQMDEKTDERSKMLLGDVHGVVRN